MYDIAVCDDCELDRRRLMKHINTNHYEFRIHEYESGNDLLRAMEVIRFVTVFLDVQMKGMNGEETAKRIRDLDTNLILVFYTGFAEPSPQSFEVQPYRYIMKNMSDSQINEYVRAALDHVLDIANMPNLLTNINKKQIVIKPEHVIYIEKYKKSTRVHIVQHSYKFYNIQPDRNGYYPEIRMSEPLEETYEKLNKYGFGYPHASYIINFSYLRTCTAKTFELADIPLIFHISRSKSKEFNEAKVRFIRAKYVGGV